MTNYSLVTDDDGNYALDAYPALQRYVQMHDCELDCRWSIFAHKWMSYILEDNKRIYEAEHVEPKESLRLLDEKVEWQLRSRPHPLIPQCLIIRSLLEKCGGSVSIDIPLNLDPADFGLLLGMFDVENVSARIDGDAVIVRLRPAAKV